MARSSATCPNALLAALFARTSPSACTLGSPIPAILFHGLTGVLVLLVRTANAVLEAFTMQMSKRDTPIQTFYPLRKISRPAARGVHPGNSLPFFGQEHGSCLLSNETKQKWRRKLDPRLSKVILAEPYGRLFVEYNNIRSSY
jgi:hypothetical protein